MTLKPEVESAFATLQDWNRGSRSCVDALARIRKALEEAQPQPKSKEYVECQQAFLRHDLLMVKSGMQTVEWMMKRLEEGAYD